MLRPYLEQGQAWNAVHDLVIGKIALSWGKFRYAHTDPTTSDLGFMAVATQLSDFAQANFNGDAVAAAAAPEFAVWLLEMKRGYVPLPETTASAVGTVDEVRFKELSAGQPAYDVICCYESEAIQALQKDKELVVLYPNPSVASEVSAVVFSKGDWVSPAQREAAVKLLDFLSDQDSVKMALYDRMRPMRETKALSIQNVITTVEPQGVRASVALTQVPPYAAANNALVKWNSLATN
ncbi:MAG: hypothetical protein OHK0029_40810 [Armatimonadaceae bacterium]